PGFTDEALAILKQKKNVRLLELGELGPATAEGLRLSAGRLVRSVQGGLLVQDADVRRITAAELQVVTERAPSDAEVEQLLFAWKVVKHVKSNAIVLARDFQTIGV